MSNTILAFVEQRNGEIKKSSLESLTVAASLAKELGANLAAVLIGSGISGQASSLGAYGASTVYVADQPLFEHYSTEGYAACVNVAWDSASAVMAVFPASAMGKDLAPRVAAKRESNFLADAVQATIEGGALVIQRPMYAGKVLWKLKAPVENTVLTLRPNVFTAKETGGDAAVETLEVAVEPRAKVVSVHQVEKEVPDVAEADVIVSGGRGLKEPENFSLVYDLAKELGAAVGASRAVVDAGWIDHDHQVGQTGKVVSPTLYIACGISGAIQHLAGMRTSKHIVAINKDPEAPIFQVADYGVVGDALELLPKLTEAIKGVKASA